MENKKLRRFWKKTLLYLFKMSRSNKKKKKKIDYNNKKMEKLMLLGIYDSFRKNGKHAITMNSADSKLIGSYFTEPIHNIYDLEVDDECGISNHGNTSIKIEVYEVNEAMIKKLSRHYGYYEALEPSQNIYVKEKVKSPYGEIFIFTYNDISFTCKQIHEGDWIEYLKNKNK